MANRIQLRRDGAQQWANVNPIFAQGELGIEIDTSRIKIGDGVTAWNSLRYERPLETESNTSNTLVKRDADGNFEAGSITASLIGNAATATRLANARQIQLGGDMSGAGTFDGSSNLTITAELNYVTALPHYDAENLAATGTYTRFTVDSRGRIVNADSPTTLSDFGITDAQPLDSDVSSLANMTGFGLISRQSEGTLVNRTLTVGSGRLVVQNGNGQSSNPFLDLADTTVVVGSYNPIPAIVPGVTPKVSATTGEETVNTVNLTVDRYGRITYANTSPIATATEGAKSGTSFTTYDNAVAYSRFSKVIASNGRCYQAAIRDIPAGLGEPSHNTQNGDSDDQGGWRDLGTDSIEQKGLASFDQEDFDVDSNGHVTIAANAIENSQLQSRGLLMFTDQNATETFELDPERTTDNAYHGITKLNHININNRTGGSVFRIVGYDTAEYPFQPGILGQGSSYPSIAPDDANGNGLPNSGSSLTGAVDINLDTTLSGNLTLDVTKADQFIKRTSGNLEFALEVNEAANRSMDINVTNAGAGDATLNITVDQDITINVTDTEHRVNIEDFHIQDNVLSTTNSTMVLDPNDDDDATGVVRIRGDLTVDGTTTTVNSTVTTIQDPIITLGGEDTLTSDDNLDRGIEFRYYDSQERFGFFGWDEDYADGNIWNGTGGYRFLYNATNTNEVFAGTDAALIAGNLRLTTNTGSTWKTPTTGTLVVTGGVGISENINVGGTAHIAGNVEIDGTLDIDSTFTVRNGTTPKFTVANTTGNTVIEGTVDIQLETEITDNLIVRADNKEFLIKNDAGTTQFVVDTDNGNTAIEGTLDVDGGVTFNSTLDVDLATTLNNTLDVDLDSTFHDDITLDTAGKYFKITNGTNDRFTIFSTNGNTDIRGTLDVGSATHLESSLVVDGNVTLGDSSSDTLTVNADVTFTDDLTVNATVDFDSTLNVDGAVDFNSTLVVDGQTTIYDSLILQSDNEVLNINNTAGQTQFSVDFDNGNTVIGRVGQGTGTLIVHGDATFNDNTSFTDNVTIGNANTDTLTVNSVTTFTDNATINGNLTVDGNTVLEGNLTVNGSTTTINSTTQTLDDPVFTLGGDTAPTGPDAKDRGLEFRYYDNSAKIGFFGWDNSAGRYAFYHNATNSSEAFAGNRSGIDAGSIKLFDTTNATNSSTGALIVGGGASVGLDLYVGDDLNVTDDLAVGGLATIGSTLDVTDDFRINTNKFTVDAQTGNVSALGTLVVQDQTTIYDSVLINASNETFRIRSQGNDRFTVDTDNGNTVINGTVTIAGTTQVNAFLDVNSNANIQNGLFVGGATNINNTLDVDGDFAVRTSGNSDRFTIASSTGNFTTSGNGSITGTLSVTGQSTLTDRVTVNANSTASNLIGNAAIVVPNGGINVYEDSFFGEDVFFGPNNGTTVSIFGATGNVTATGTVSASTLSATTGNIATITTTSNVNVGGSLIVNTNKFIVAAASGNTDIAGALDVTGGASVGGTLGVTNAVDFDSTLNVDGQTTLNAALTQNSSSLFKDDIILRGSNKILKLQNGSSQDRITLTSTTGEITATGAGSFGSMAVTNNTTIGGTLGVTGQITGDVTGDLTGIADKADLVDVTDTPTSNLTYYPTFVASNSGHTEIRTDSGQLQYNPFENRLTVSNFRSTTDFEVQGNLNVTGALTFFQSQVGSIANHDTDALSEGTSNLYFTNERVDDRVAALINGGTGIAASYNDAGNLLTLSVDFSEINTDNLTEGSSNRFFTQARTRNAFTYGTGIEHNGSGTISVTQSDIETDNITEGTTNLFFTNARARGAFSAGGDLSYNASTGEFSVTTFSGAYSDLSGLPTLFSGAYADLTGKPVLATVATSGSYNDLSNLPALFSGAYADLTGKPTLGTAAATASTDYATAAQGALADTALQSETIDLTTLKAEVAASANFADFKSRIAAL